MAVADSMRTDAAGWRVIPASAAIHLVIMPGGWTPVCKGMTDRDQDIGGASCPARLLL